MEEPENAAAIDEALRRDGIALITGTTATAAANSERGIMVEFSDGTHLEAERPLVATRRRPDPGALGAATWASTPASKIATITLASIPSRRKITKVATIRHSRESALAGRGGRNWFPGQAPPHQ